MHATNTLKLFVCASLITMSMSAYGLDEAERDTFNSYVEQLKKDLAHEREYTKRAEERATAAKEKAKKQAVETEALQKRLTSSRAINVMLLASTAALAGKLTYDWAKRNGYISTVHDGDEAGQLIDANDTHEEVPVIERVG